MRETVAGLRMATNSGVPDLTAVKAAAKAVPRIIDLKPNSCSLSNVQMFVTDNPDVRKQVEARDTAHVLDFDALEPSKLLKACTALEVVTEARPSDDPKKFVWQRNGDLRYSFMHWVDRPQVQGPLGYGPSSPDPETGEIISATAFIYGAALDTYAKFAMDSVRAGQRPARPRRPAFGQDDQRRARRDVAGQPGEAGAEDDRRRPRHGQGQDAGARADARQAARSRSAPASTTSRWRRSRAPASRSCCSMTTCCPPSSAATAPATSRRPTCWSRR